MQSHPKLISWAQFSLCTSQTSSQVPKWSRGHARNSGSHSGGHATGLLPSARLLFSLGVVMFGMKVAQTTEAATPMRMSARELNPPFFAYTA